MSKRYGRNQKRAHRTRIAELEAEVAALKKDYAGMARTAQLLSDEIECAKRIVGEYCVAFNPRSLTMQMGTGEYAEVIQYERDFNPGVTHYWDINPAEMLKPISVHRIRLPILCVLADREHIRGSRHMKVVYNGKAWGYAIDPTAWRMARYPRDLCGSIARSMTDMIYEEMSKEVGKPSHAPGFPAQRRHTRDEPDPRVTFPNFNFGMPELPDFLR
jgi:hypothetical protein